MSLSLVPESESPCGEGSLCVDMKVIYEEHTWDEWLDHIIEEEHKKPVGEAKVYGIKSGGETKYWLRCFKCGDIAVLINHQKDGMIKVENGVVDIRGPGAHSILDTGCGAHYHIYLGEIAP